MLSFIFESIYVNLKNRDKSMVILGYLALLEIVYNFMENVKSHFWIFQSQK